jgi:hypothetical protein
MQNRRDDAGRVAEGHAIAGSGKDDGHPNQDRNPINDEDSKFCHAGWKQGDWGRGNVNVQDEIRTRSSKFEANSKFEFQFFNVSCYSESDLAQREQLC